MQYQIDNFKVIADNTKPLDLLIKEKYQLNKFTYRIITKSIDARDKEKVFLVYRLLIDTKEKVKGKNVSIYQEKTYDLKYHKWEEISPVIVGFGPAGIFAALYLARCGAKPIILERGGMVDDRINDVNNFIKDKILNPNSNIQFGEGGAGTFSDGKLTTNLKNPLIKFILEEFVKHGAKEDILYEAMPHVGTDYLVKVVKNIREEIISLGGKFYFNTCFYGVDFKEDILTVKAKNSISLEFATKHLLLGIGHSAKDTIRMLYNDVKVNMEPKAFSMGVRIEHPQRLINEGQYGRFAEYLPPAYYKFAYHNQRGIYTFCMCPGGYVMASQSDEGSIVTNGMSNQNRANFNSNAAVLVDVKPSDYFENSVLDGLAYQEKYERLAFEIGKDYRAPANLVKEFLNDEVADSLRSVNTTYPHGLVFADFRRCLPDFVVEGLKEGIINFDHKLKGFANDDAVMIGIESRSSCPIRMLRDEHRQSNINGIYPIGEGAGHAGGITSAALDGLITAIMIASNKL